MPRAAFALRNVQRLTIILIRCGVSMPRAAFALRNPEEIEEWKEAFRFNAACGICPAQSCPLKPLGTVG